MTAPGEGRRLMALARAEAKRDAREAARTDRSGARPAPEAITDRPRQPERALAQTVACPACKEPAGQQCRTRTRSPKPMEFHPSRLTAAEAAALADLSPRGTGS